MRRAAPGLLALVLALPGTAQSPAPAPGRARILQAAREVAAKARYACFVTVDAAGLPQARIVDPAPPEGEAFIVWFATNVRTRKVAEVQAEGRTALAWFDRGGMATLTLRGRAEVVRDPVEKARRWRKAWAPFYPGGASDQDLVLIRFQPSSLEISSPRHQLTHEPATWRPVILEFHTTR